jgi:anthranilate synthase
MQTSFTTKGGISVTRTRAAIDPKLETGQLIGALDEARGLLLSSGTDYPGRYSRFDIGFVNPPLVLTGRGREFTVSALNARGRVLMPAVIRALSGNPGLIIARASETAIAGAAPPGGAELDEEDRSRQPSLITVLRALLELFGADDRHLGFYGAFGYDLAFQFETIKPRMTRELDQRDLVLYLADDLLVVDHQRETAFRYSYDFAVDGKTTDGMKRDGAIAPFTRGDAGPIGCDHEPGAYARIVARAKEKFAKGDLFEAVPGQTFHEPCSAAPSAVFRRLAAINPAPFGALINLGEGEFLVSASPEMFVRSDGSRIETCPMCTDVDRNDKARICEAGSVKVIGRRQIELYSRVIHTVDHVEGTLRPGYDALDAFLAHAWAVTVTGAPKAWAMQFCEDVERTPRRWYGGAIGGAMVDGGLNTGLTIRTVRMKDGKAEVRAGATLLFDSDPQAEDAECQLKASAMLAAVRDASAPPKLKASAPALPRTGEGQKIILIDHEDSFVHMLGDLFRRTGAEVRTLRWNRAAHAITREHADLIVLSPGPGKPSDFDVSGTIAKALAAGLPVFGVCLGLQGIAEHFGGKLGQLDEPVHGKASAVSLTGGRFMTGLPDVITVGRYHSLYADRAALPTSLTVTGQTEDGLIMAVEHKELPVAAVQFHPESVLSEAGDLGPLLIARAVAGLTGERLAKVA